MGKISQWAQGIHDIVGDYNATCIEFTGARQQVIATLKRDVRREEEVKNDIIEQARAVINDTVSQRLADPSYRPPEYEKYRAAERYHKKRYATVSAVLLLVVSLLTWWGHENSLFVTSLVLFSVVVMGVAWLILREKFSRWRTVSIAQTKVSSVVPPDEQREITQQVKQRNADRLHTAQEISQTSKKVLNIITNYAPRNPYVMGVNDKKTVMQSLNTAWIEETYGEEHFEDMNLPPTVTFSVLSPEPLERVLSAYEKTLTTEARDAFHVMTTMMSELCQHHPDKVVTKPLPEILELVVSDKVQETTQ